MYVSFKSCILGGLSLSNFQLFYQQKFPGKEIESGLAAVIQLYKKTTLELYGQFYIWR